MIQADTAMAEMPPKANAVLAPEATALLLADHNGVGTLFAAYAKTDTPERKKTIAARICTDLSIQMQIEEEIFYPAIRKVMNADGMVAAAIAEHAELKLLIAQSEGIDPEDEMLDVAMKVMGEYVKRHTKREHECMFLHARASRLDMAQLGTRLATRKAELLMTLSLQYVRVHRRVQ